MFGYDSCYYPAMYFCPYKWSDEHIKLKAKIVRGEQIFILDFLLSGTEYDQFIDMRGAFSGVDNNGETVVIKILDTDVITIIESDYSEVKSKYQKKCSDDIKLFYDRERKRKESYEKFKAQRKEEESKKRKEKEEEENRIKQIEAEKQKRCGFWYRLFHREKVSDAG